MMPPLDLTPAMIVRPGTHVITARTQGERIRKAHASAEAARLRKCRERMA